MSKVKIQGHASGTGVLTVTAPNTSTDRTITLPDTTGTLLDENSSVPAANLTGTVADARFPATLPAASAANLTAIPAANLTGTLPAISGASLTGITTGKVLQVVSTTVTDRPSITSSGSWVDWSGLSVTITPSASSSKILVTASINVSNNADTAQRLVRGSTAICIGDQVGSNRRRSTTGGNIHRGDHEMMQYSVNYLDSPNTTSATTYKMQATDNNSQTQWLNQELTDSDQTDDSTGASTITVMEIGA